MASDPGLAALRAVTAYIRHPGSGSSLGEYGHPCPTNWLMPCKKCRSASAFRSKGVARNAGECNHVQVSDEITGLPNRCPADEAQRRSENSRHIINCPLPSPSGRSAYRLLESVTGGYP